ncbi:MAG: phosphopantothenoylcysteine decarboxylase [Verrucomicrobia bacterium]|nr:phosphopantothenoylcysteine decarboxylase [Verrucomicrobiota bacterium]
MDTSLKTAHVVVGVTGSIAAHKAIDLVSLLTKGCDGTRCEVRAVMTADAQKFVTEVPFRTLSRNAVVRDLYESDEQWTPRHIALADWADLLVIAPATANTIAKLAHGIADNALTCLALALRQETSLLIAPAMNGRMWQHPATVENVRVLKSRGVEFIGPEEGLQACGYSGKGRMSSVDQIAERVRQKLSEVRI